MSSKNPELVILAAGMGSRYGGLKQIDSVDDEGHIIIDYSIYDAIKAGFKDITFIIKHEIEEDFKEIMDKHLEGKDVRVKYVFQQLDMLPEGFSVPEGRTKPWGTGHAVLACKGIVDTPALVINADDYYGKEAYRQIYQFLDNARDGEKYSYCMVAYEMGKTVTENGSVARGICQTDENQFLTSVVERTQIEQYEGGIHFTTDGGETWEDVAADTPVSMNMWGFTGSFMEELKAYFPKFLTEDMPKNPEKAEMFLPTVVSQLINTDKTTVKVLRTGDKWYGVTYAADKPMVIEALKNFTAEGKYPDGLWK